MRRNSSVKDLIQRLEGSTMGSTHRSANLAENSLPSTGSSTSDDNVFSKTSMTEAVYENVKMKPYESMTLKPKKTGERTERKISEDEKATAPVFTAPERPRPVPPAEPLLLPEVETSTESWVDGATFFHNLNR